MEMESTSQLLHAVAGASGKSNTPTVDGWFCRVNKAISDKCLR